MSFPQVRMKMRSRKHYVDDNEASTDEIVRHPLHSQPIAPSAVVCYPMDRFNTLAHRLQLRVPFVVQTQVEHNTRSPGSRGVTAVLRSAGSHSAWWIATVVADR